MDAHVLDIDGRGGVCGFPIGNSFRILSARSLGARDAKPLVQQLLYRYVDSQPILSADPLGLWTVSAELVVGVGVGVTVSYSEGTLEILSKAAAGLSGGVTFDAQGRPSSHSRPDGNGFIARTTATVGASAGSGAGRPGVVVGGSVVSGNAVTTSRGGGFLDVPRWPIPIGIDTSKAGARAGATVGVEVGTYTNWRGWLPLFCR